MHEITDPIAHPDLIAMAAMFAVLAVCWLLMDLYRSARYARRLEQRRERRDKFDHRIAPFCCNCATCRWNRKREPSRN